MTTAVPRIFVFQCSGSTYMECIERSLFGSNDPWPLQVRAGDQCLLHHYEYDVWFALWRASGDGGKRLVPRAWGGRFPFQVRVAQATETIIDLPKGTVGNAERILEGARAEQVLRTVLGMTALRESRS